MILSAKVQPLPPPCCCHTRQWPCSIYWFRFVLLVRLAQEMAPFKPAWLEEPVPPENLKALEKVAAQGRHAGRDR